MTACNALPFSTGLGPVVYDLSLLMSANIFGGFAGYGLEYYMRRGFQQGIMLEQQKKLEIETENLRTAQELARTVAHEFNNPLAIIQATYELHTRKSEDILSISDQETLSSIPNNVNRMSNLVQQLLAFLRVEFDPLFFNKFVHFRVFMEGPANGFAGMQHLIDDIGITVGIPEEIHAGFFLGCFGK